jgi:hypothetical protein
LRIDAFACADGQRHGDAARVGRQLLQSAGVGAGGRRQQASARGDEGADRGFHREMAAARQRQRFVVGGVGLGHAQHAGADLAVQRTEFVVPGRVILRHGGLHPGIGRDRAGNQQQHFWCLRGGRKVASRHS